MSRLSKVRYLENLTLFFPRSVVGVVISSQELVVAQKYCLKSISRTILGRFRHLSRQNSPKIDDLKFSHGQIWAWSNEHVPEVWALGSRVISVLGFMKSVCAKYVIFVMTCR